MGIARRQGLPRRPISCSVQDSVGSHWLAADTAFEKPDSLRPASFLAQCNTFAELRGSFCPAAERSARELGADRIPPAQLALKLAQDLAAFASAKQETCGMASPFRVACFSRPRSGICCRPRK